MRYSTEKIDNKLSLAEHQPKFVYLQVEDGLTQFPATGSSSPQTHQRQSSVLKKERNRVKCNLCKMVLINEEKFLLAHVQRVHGA